MWLSLWMFIFVCACVCACANVCVRMVLRLCAWGRGFLMRVYVCLSMYVCVCVQTSQIYGGLPHSSPHADREGRKKQWRDRREREEKGGFCSSLCLSLPLSLISISSSLSLCLPPQSCWSKRKIIPIIAEHVTWGGT